MVVIHVENHGKGLPVRAQPSFLCRRFDISGLGLSGTMGYLLSDLMSLKILDLSNNNLHDTIPYQLPPNVTSVNLAGNNFSGNLPYSISTMITLTYLNVSHNMLSLSVGDYFANLARLGTL